MDDCLRTQALQFVANGIDHLLLPQLTREVVALRPDDVSITRVGQCALSIEVMPALREAISEQEIVEAALAIDVDAADVVDDFFEGVEIDAHKCVDRLSESTRDGVAQQAGSLAGIAARLSGGVREIDAVRSERSDVHPQVEWNRDDGGLLCRGLEADQQDRVGEIVVLWMIRAA